MIEFHTEHYAPVRLEHGDSVYFDSLMRHAFVTVGGGSEAVIVSVSLSDTRALWDGDEPWRPGLGRVEAGPPRQARDGGSRDVKTNVIKEANMHRKTQ